jgi:RNA polymerase sigma-70 factor (ECF subfamily)
MDPLSEVWAHHHAAVLRFARHLCGDRSRADDLAQEAFVRLWTTSSTIRTETVRAYLFAIVRHEYLRRRRREWRFVEVPNDLLDPGLSPLDRTAALEEVRRVMTAMAALDEDDRVALLMKADGDLSYEDIGTALGVSAATARVRVHRARRRLLQGTREGNQP